MVPMRSQRISISISSAPTIRSLMIVSSWHMAIRRPPRSSGRCRGNRLKLRVPMTERIS